MKYLDFIKSEKVSRLYNAFMGESSPMRIYSNSMERNIEKTILYTESRYLYYDAAHTKPVPTDDLVNLFIDGVLIIPSGGDMPVLSPLFVEFVETENLESPEDSEITGVIWTFNIDAFKSANISEQPIPTNMIGSDGVGLFEYYCCDRHNIYAN